MKDLSVSVHYLNEYIKKMWALGPAVPQGPIDCVDAGHDQVTECQSNLGNDTGNSNTLAFDSGGESDTELQTATMHSPNVERKREAFRDGRNSTEEQKLLDRTCLFPMCSLCAWFIQSCS